MAAAEIKDADYIILDKNYYPLARAVLLSAPSDTIQQVRILGGNADKVLKQDLIQLVGMKDGSAALVGKVCGVSNGILVLEPIRQLGGDVRMNLRIPVKFNTYLYPTGRRPTWKGRRPAVGCDLSCGGVAFFCADEMEPGEVVEIVLPMRSHHPMLVKCKVLHKRQSPSSVPLYAAEFVDMLEEQAAMVREVVFGIQIDQKVQQSKKHGRHKETAPA